MGQEWSQKVAGDCPERVYTPIETVKYVQELLKIDQEYTRCIDQCVHGFLSFRMADMGKPDDVREAVSNREFIRLSGSVADGGSICRWFRYGIPDAELDITYQVGIVPPEKRTSVLANLGEKRGFLKLYSSRETYECLHPILRRDRPELSRQFHTQRPGQMFVNTVDMQEDVSAIWPHMDGEGEIQKVSSLLMGVDESALRLFLTEKVEGPSNMMELIVTLRNEPAIAYSSDSVLALKVEDIPEEIKPYLARLENKLPPQVLAELRGAPTLIVAKKSPGAQTEEEWRYSTSEIENVLMKTWNMPGNNMKMVCYFTLKCLFYRYVRGIEVSDKHIPSYALKTKMLWMVETMDTSEWTDNNFMKNMKKILNSLMVDVQNRNLRNYFIPEMNVIDPNAYPPQLTEAVAMKLNEITNNLEAFLPKDLEKMIKQGEAIIKALKLIQAYISFKTMKADQKRRRDRGQNSGLGDALNMLNNAGVDVGGLLQGFLGKKPKK